MNHLYLVIKYFCEKYPHKSELSKARLTKMVYLADWKCALDYGNQLTRIRWEFNHHGPYVDDVVQCACDHPDDFEIAKTSNAYGSPKEVITLRPAISESNMPDDVKTILDFVIKATAPLYWAPFIKLVYSTYPIVTQPRGARLNLVELANDYKAEIEANQNGNRSE